MAGGCQHRLDAHDRMRGSAAARATAPSTPTAVTPTIRTAASTCNRAASWSSIAATVSDPRPDRRVIGSATRTATVSQATVVVIAGTTRNVAPGRARRAKPSRADAEHARHRRRRPSQFAAQCIGEPGGQRHSRRNGEYRREHHRVYRTAAADGHRNRGHRDDHHRQHPIGCGDKDPIMGSRRAANATTVAISAAITADVRSRVRVWVAAGPMPTAGRDACAVPGSGRAHRPRRSRATTRRPAPRPSSAGDESRSSSGRRYRAGRAGTERRPRCGHRRINA